MKALVLPEVFEKNLMRLKTRFPDIYDALAVPNLEPIFAYEPIRTPGGHVNLSVTLPDGCRVCFHEDAEIDGGIQEQLAAWQSQAEDYFFCIGIGLGYVPLLASQNSSAKPNIIIIEPNPEILKLALTYIDLGPLLAYERLDIHLGPDLSAAEIIAKYGERIFFGKNRLVSHGPSRLIYGETFKCLENDIIENIRVARNIGYTAKYAGERIFSNTIKNLSSLFTGPDLGALKGRFKGCPAICVAAGPSLDKYLDCLKRTGRRALILCADSAVRSLVNEGIVPHVVVTTDMNAVNFEKLRTSLDFLRQSVLVYSIEANPDNVGKFLGVRRIAVTSKNAMLNDWLGPKWGLNWKLPAMTSVSHTAVFTALALGAAPIILVGMDFAYTSGKSHANGSVFHYPADRNSAIEIDGVRGHPVLSLPQLIADRKQIENAMAQSGVRYIDTSLDGALIQGAENRSLNEVMATVLQKGVDVCKIIDNIDWKPSVAPRAVVAEFDDMAKAIDRFISACQDHERNCRLHCAKIAGPGRADQYARLVLETEKEMAVFDRHNGKLLSLLKLIRYADVKDISQRLDAIRTVDGTLHSTTELEVYADYFASVERAARQFKEVILDVSRYFREEDWQLRNMLRKDTAPDQILLLAKHYQKHDVFWRAERRFLQYAEKHPDDIEALLDLGRMYAQDELWSLAIAHTKKMKLRFPGDDKILAFEMEIAHSIKALYETAATLMDAGGVEEARRKYYELISLGVSDAGLSALQERIKTYDQANTKTMMKDEGVQLSEEQELVLQDRIRNCLENGAIEQAIGILEGLALENGATAGEAREKIGDLRLSQGDVSSAVWHYRQALQISSQNRILESKIERILQQTGQDTVLQENMMNDQEVIQTGASNDRKSAYELYQTAQSLIVKECYSDAVQLLEQLLTRFPNYALAHNDLGVLYYNLDDAEKSVLHYQEAARIDPGNPVFKKNLADLLYIVKGDVQSALEIYVDLLKQNPEDKETLLALAQICTEQGKLEDAAIFYRRVLELDPMNSDAQRGITGLGFNRTGSSPAGNGICSAISKQANSASSLEAPSPVIRTTVQANSRRYTVQIPENEVFRIKNIFEMKEYAVMDKRRGNGAYHVFDVGANVGLFALSIHASHPQSKIYCFEPSPFAQTLLEANVGEFPEMMIYTHGLYNQDSESLMHVHRFNTGQNSIRFDGKHHAGTVSVQLRDAGGQFDALGLSHLDVLKIDTEGCEVQILQSLGDRLDKVDYILVEYHSEQDRRAIDDLLDRFCLFGSHAVMPGIGTVRYVHPSLV